MSIALTNTSSVCVIARVLSILSDPLNLVIIRLLQAQPGLGAREICALLAAIGFATVRTNVCNHLRTLRDAGLVERRHDGRSAYFACSQAVAGCLSQAAELVGITQEFGVECSEPAAGE